MTRLRRLLIITLAAMTLTGVAHAEDNATENEAVSGNFLTNTTITCSTAWPSAVIGCWWEKPLLVWGDIEFSVALDAQLALGGQRESYLAPMFSIAWYGPSASIWLEAALPPNWLPLPHIGRSDAFRAGFSYRIP